MLGMGDVWVAVAYLANIAIALICVIYGLINWNRDHDDNGEEKP